MDTLIFSMRTTSSRGRTSRCLGRQAEYRKKATCLQENFRRNAERPGSLPAFVVCCELYRLDYFAMQVAQKLLNSAISASLSWPCISVSRSLSAISAWVNSCVATFP